MTEIFRGGFCEGLLPAGPTHWMEEAIVGGRAALRRSKCGLERYDCILWETDGEVTCPDCQERARAEMEIDVDVPERELVPA